VNDTVAAPSPGRGLLQPGLWLENGFLVLIVLALIGVFSVFTPPGTFFSVNNLRNIALDTAEILVLAGGEMFVIVAAGLDLSIGSLVVFNAVVFAEVLTKFAGTAAQVANFQYPRLWLGLLLGVLASLAAGAAWGAINGSISVRWRVPPFITTLGVAGMALGFAQLITGGLNVPNVPPSLQEFFGSGRLFGIPWLVVVAVTVIAALWVLLAKTRYGLRTFAIGASAEASRRAGISVSTHTITLYVLVGVLTGVVGIMDVARFQTASIAAHTQDALIAITAVVIGGTSLFGGTGRMSGTILGAFIPAILRNGFVLLGVQPFWQNVAIGAVLILAVFSDQVRRRRLPALGGR
jgi:ribose transport system permease protein